MHGTFRNIDQLSKAVEKAVAKKKIEVVSFDLFNTILYRTVHPENIIVKSSAEYVGKLFESDSVSPVMDLLKARSKAWGLLVDDGAEDCGLTKLVGKWLEVAYENKIKITRKIVNDIVAHEFYLERKVIFTKPAIVDLIKRLKKNETRLIYVSDMYLEPGHIETLLLDNGLEGCFDAGYLSGDVGLLKKSGNLFKHVCDQEQVDSSHILHIGDNRQADYKIPRSLGMNAFWLDDTLENSRKKFLECNYRKQLRSSDWAGVTIAASARQNKSLPDLDSCRYGYENFGPVFTAFVHKVFERVVQEKIEHVFFIARDGFVLKRIFDELTQNLVYKKSHRIQSHYLCLSRATAFLASKPELTKLDDQVLELTSYDNSIRNILGAFRIEDEFLKERAEKYSIDDIYRSHSSNLLEHEPFKKLIKDKQLRQYVDKQNSQMHDNLYGYLKQNSFFQDSKIALIDVGWHASIQRFLYQAYGNKEEYPEVKGFYLGIKDDTSVWLNSLNSVEAVIADSSRNFWFGNAGFNYVVAIEAFVRGPHGTTTGYVKKGRQFVPLMKMENGEARQNEKKDDATVVPIQSGILEYARQYSFYCNLFAVNADDSLCFAKAILARSFRHPRKHEAREILPLVNVSDFGGFKIDQMGQRFWDDPFHTLKLLTIVKNAEFWRNGVLAASDVSLLKYLYSIIQAHKYGKRNKYIDKDSTTRQPLEQKARKKSGKKSENKWAKDFEVQLDNEFKQLQEKYLSETKRVTLDPLKAPIAVIDHFMLEMERVLINIALSAEGHNTYQSDSFSFAERLLSIADAAHLSGKANTRFSKLLKSILK